MTSKGQVWSMDAISALVLLSLMFLLTILLWNNLAFRWNSSDDYRQMQTNAFFAGDALMTTSGYPRSWEMLDKIDGNITSFGLATSRNELSPVKLERLVAENGTAYPHLKRGLGLSKYDLSINVTDLEREESYYEIGKFAGGLDTVVITERMGLLNGTPVIVRMEVWR